MWLQTAAIRLSGCSKGQSDFVRSVRNAYPFQILSAENDRGCRSQSRCRSSYRIVFRLHCSGELRSEILNMSKYCQVGRAIGGFVEKTAPHRIGPHWAPAVADRKIFAVDAVLDFHDARRAVQELLPGGAFIQNIFQWPVFENIAEMVFGIACGPASFSKGAFRLVAFSMRAVNTGITRGPR